MKRLFFTLLILTIFLFVITSCKPVDGSSFSNSMSSESSGDQIGIIKPSTFLVDDEGNKTYALYFFMNKNGENCVVAADIYITLDGNSNTAPVIYCN